MAKYEVLYRERGLTNAVKIIPEATTSPNEIAKIVRKQAQIPGRSILVVNLSPKTGEANTKLDKEFHLITPYHFEEIRELPILVQDSVFQEIGNKICKSTCSLIFNSRD